MSTLPPPGADALAHSERLRAVLQEQVFAAGGALPFSRFMELCLYAPGLGYYSAGATKFGAAGDFVTAPEVSQMFGELAGLWLADLWSRAGRPANARFVR